MNLIFYNPVLNKIEFGDGEMEPYLEIMFMERWGWVYIGNL